MSGCYEDLRKRQYEIAQSVSLKSRFASLSEITTVAAADVSSRRFSEVGYAAVMVFSYPALKPLERKTHRGRFTIPYIPGLLAFREAPLIQRCLDRLAVRPDVLICDGLGLAHPRRCGIACYLGVMNDLVAVGCGKSRLIGEFRKPGIGKGEVTDLWDRGEKMGEVVRTRERVKPLFISPGNGIDFVQATQLILSLCSKYRQPDPIRAVHEWVNRVRIAKEGG